MSNACGHCGFTGGLVHKGTVTAESNTEFHKGYGDVDVQVIWSLSRCPNCEQPTLETYVWADPFSDPEDTRVDQLYPTPLDNSALPARVQKLYDAALRVKLVEPSFYAVGVRRMLEAVCRDKGAGGSTLDELVKDLVKLGQLPEVFAGMATQLRYLGNWGAHDAETDVLDSDVPLIDEFAHAILDYLYRAPAQLAAVESALETRYREAREG